MRSSSSSSSRSTRVTDRGKTKSRTKKQTVGERVNPEIVECLQLLLEERQRASRGHIGGGGDRLLFSYRKALKSVHRYPLKLYSGRQAKILDGIGPVLADKIDQYLHEHHPELLLQEYETLRQTNQGRDAGEDNEGTNGQRKRKKNAAAAAAAGGGNSGVEKQCNHHTRTAIAVKKKTKKNKKYVPRFKSAAWAMLVTMYCEAKRDPSQTLSKKDIIQLSQHLTDTPMLPQVSCSTRQEHGKQFYCGWTSMNSTLIKKQLVLTTKRKPFTYTLTVKGRRLARKLYSAVRTMGDFHERFEDDDFVLSSDDDSDDSGSEENEEEDSQATVASAEDISASSQTSSVDSLWQDEDDDNVFGFDIFDDSSGNNLRSETTNAKKSQTSKRAATSELETRAVVIPKRATFRQCMYNGFDGKPVFSKDEAQIKVSAQDGLLFQVMVTLPVSEVEQLQNDPPSGFFFEEAKECYWLDEYSEAIGWMKDECAVEMCSADELLLQLFPDEPISSIKDTRAARRREVLPGQSKNTNPQDDSQGSAVDSQSINEPMNNVNLGIDGTESRNKRRKEKQPHSEMSVVQDNAPPSPLPGPRIDFRQFCQDNISVSSTSRSSSHQRACPYQVVLMVDPRERQRGTSDRGGRLMNKLTSHITDVKFEQQNLIVGDFLWVARHSRHPEDEYVLDFIVERKTMDDLASSITDNRFKEQKFRLSQTKCRHVWYLVEGVNMRSQNRLPPETLESAVISTQLEQNFFVKRTTTLDKSLEFLVLLTRSIQGLLRKGTAKEYAMGDPEDGSPMTLRHFNANFSKQATNPVEIFGRQLCHVKGISATIAQAIVDKYPSPMAFWKMLTEDDNANELADLSVDGPVQGLSTCRRLGPSLSQFLHDLYTADTY